LLGSADTALTERDVSPGLAAVSAHGGED